MWKGCSVSAKRKNLRQDTSGAVMVEFTAALTVFLLLLFGSVEFANVFYQWNAATKAVQWGARVAAVSDPVAANLIAFTGVENGTLPGVVLPIAAYDCVCKGSTSQCTGTMPASAPGCNIGTTGLPALKRIVYGVSTATSCGTSTSNRDQGMCHLFPGLTIQNVEVEYQYTGLGYAGRPGAIQNSSGVNLSPGAVPTITVRLHQRVDAADTNTLKFQFILIGGLMKIGNAAFPDFIDLPSFATTVTGEDLTATGS